MWDVKGYIFGSTLHLGPCFTLTMWDVKILFAVIAFAAILCFTLTMWDVKDVYAGNLVNFNIVLP